MPLSKHLKSSPVFPPSTRARPCPICNNLDPRNHISTRYFDAPVPATGKRKRGSTVANAGKACALSLPVDARDLIRRAEQCRFCAVLVGAMDAIADGWRDRRGANRALVVEMKWKGTINILLGDGKKMVEIYGAIDHTPPWPSLGIARDIDPDPSSDATYDFVDYCIETCEKEHKDSCVNGQYGQKRPARLLELQSDEKTMRLIDGRKGEYIALSHCWGKDLPLTTTVENLEERRKGFALDMLPPLYRDAVEIMDKLDIRLIWIDSLCIIQNQHVDWEIESAKMADIYSGSYLTIAATVARDSTQRILSSRRQRKKITYKNTKGDEHRLRVRLVDSQHSNQENGAALPAGPLSTRAWTFQEHLLSRRVLHYSETEVLFECRSGSAWESKPKLIPSTKVPSTPAHFFNLTHPTTKHERHFQAWRGFVASYSCRATTYASDRLPALSGIARALQPNKSAYHAGLWRKGFPGDLAWSTAPWLVHPHQTPIPKNFRAPSWSWASVEAQVRFEKAVKDAVTSLLRNIVVEKVERCDQEALQRDPFGAMAGFCKLRATGPIAKGILVAPEDYEFYYLLKLEGGRGVIEVFPDCILVADRDKDGNPVGVRRMRDNEKYETFKAPVLCLGISSDDQEGTVTGLVLGNPRDTTDTEALVRLGLFSSGRDAFSGEDRDVLIV